MVMKVLLLFCGLIAGQFTLAAQSTDYRVIIFLSPTCTMCQGYAHPLNALYEEYRNQGVDFLGIFPNYYVTDSSIAEYKEKYNIVFPLEADSAFYYTDKLGASMTPEVFLVEKATDSILYAGQINNLYIRPGRKRGNISEHYLKDALNSLLAGNPIEVKRKEPVGCYIVKN